MSTDLLIADLHSPTSGDLASAQTLGVHERTPQARQTLSRAEQGDPTGQAGRQRNSSEALEAMAVGEAIPHDEAGDRRLTAVAADLVQLTKPRIVVMILITTIASAMVAAGGLLAASELFWLLIGTAAVAGSAGAANQVWEYQIDQRMARTAGRPLAAGRISWTIGVIFTAILASSGVAVLWHRFGAAPAAVGMATWLLYVLVYTPMKTRTAWNTTVGAIAGAIPVLIGYTAAGGTLAQWSGWLIVGVLVAWQYPHFMAIAWMYRHQYDRAGFKMTTTVDPTGRWAAWQSIAGSVVLIGCGIGLCFVPGGLVHGFLASIAIVAACQPMLRASLRFAKQRDDRTARKLLRSSLLVLPAVLMVVTLRVFW